MNSVHSIRVICSLKMREIGKIYASLSHKAAAKESVSILIKNLEHVFSHQYNITEHEHCCKSNRPRRDYIVEYIRYRNNAGEIFQSDVKSL